MTALVVHQPYFLPWLGFFAKLGVADCFVALDDGGHRRNHLSRVAVLGTAGTPEWLKVPVGASQGARLREIPLPRDTGYLDRLLRTLRFSYGRAAHFEPEFPFVEQLLRGAFVAGRGSLAEANLRLIEGLAVHVDLAMPPVHRASEIAPPGERNERLLGICAAVGARTLLVGDGAMEEVHDMARIEAAGIGVRRVRFRTRHPEYAQLHAQRHGTPFTPGLSIVDALLNVGRERTAELVLGGDS